MPRFHRSKWEILCHLYEQNFNMQDAVLEKRVKYLMRYLEKELGLDKTRWRIHSLLETSRGIVGTQFIVMSSFLVTLCDAVVSCWIWVMSRHLKQQP